MREGFIIFLFLFFSQTLFRISNGQLYVKPFAGTGYFGYPSPSNTSAASSVMLGVVTGVWGDSNGNIFIVDTANSRISKVAAGTGIISTIIGVGLGSPTYTSTTVATNAALNWPIAVCGDTNGNLYVADQYNHRIRKYTAATGSLTTAIGSSVGGMGPDNIPADMSAINQPVGVFVDTAGSVYVAEVGAFRIRRALGSTNIITTLVGNGTSGYNGDNLPGIITMVKTLGGLVGDTNGNLFYCDRTSYRVRVLQVNGIVKTVAGNGLLPTPAGGDGGPATLGRINNPIDVWIDSLGALYIAEQNAPRIRLVRGGIITTLAGTGSIGASGDGGFANASTMNSPSGVFVSSVGEVFIADKMNRKIRKVTSQNIMTTFAGTGLIGDDGPATSAIFFTLSGIVGDTVNNWLYIAEQNGCRIRRVSLIDNTVKTFAGNGGCFYSGEGVQATSATIFAPRFLTLDSSRNLFIVDSSSSRVRKVDISTRIITTFYGGGYGDFVENTTATNAKLKAPMGIWLDSLGVMYLSDTSFSKVIKYSSSTNRAVTFAGTGTSAYSGDGGPAKAAALKMPSGIWGDGSRLFIADSQNNRIRAVNLVSGIITTFAGTGSGGSGGDGRAATLASLSNPIGVYGDGDRNLFITDSYSQKVRVVTQVNSTFWMMNTLIGTGAGTGYNIFTFTLATAANLNSLFGVWADTNGAVYAAESSYNRVRVTVNLYPTGQPSSQPSCQPSSQPSSEPSERPFALPTAQPSTQPSSQPSMQPTAQPLSSPSSKPSSLPSALPSAQPTLQPTSAPTAQPSSQPSTQPSSQPSGHPSSQPSSPPSDRPSGQPTSLPTGHPSAQPSSKPSRCPSNKPSSLPTVQPSDRPSGQPTSLPTGHPSAQPSSKPSRHPSNKPSSLPTVQPSLHPSSKPSHCPSSQPTSRPSPQPSSDPSSKPSACPSSIPSSQPTSRPSQRPSFLPTTQPSAEPSSRPTTQPFSAPSNQPSSLPSTRPSVHPFLQPTSQPSSQPSNKPSLRPSSHSSLSPSTYPSSIPSSRPSCRPTVSTTTIEPSHLPSALPTLLPTCPPTPSSTLSNNPTVSTSSFPTPSPSESPTCMPSSTIPSMQPSFSPSVSPTALPSLAPSPSPTYTPTFTPTCSPSQRPTRLLSTINNGSLPWTSPLSVTFPEGFIGNNRLRIQLFLFSTLQRRCSIASNISLSFPESFSVGINYIVFGGGENDQGGSTSVVLDATRRIDYGLAIDGCFRSLEVVGDINGDGFDDLLVGSPLNSVAYLLFGSAKGLQGLRDGFTIFGEAANDNFGWSLSSAGDFDGDGFNDYVICALIRSACYLLYGKEHGYSNLYMANSQSHAKGLKITGNSAPSSLGIAVSSAKDFNGDGFDDIIITQRGNIGNNVISIIYGNRQYLSSMSVLVLTEQQGFVVQSPSYSFAGISLAGIGDFNKDGYDDISIGSTPYRAGYGAQKAYIIFGRGGNQSESSTTTFAKEISLGSLAPKDGIAIDGGGFMVFAGGDVDVDGFDDLVVANVSTWQSITGGYITLAPRRGSITRSPSLTPSLCPSVAWTETPTTLSPSFQETVKPTSPTLQPTSVPSGRYSARPSTAKPTTTRPSPCPSFVRTSFPSFVPTFKPSLIPTTKPTQPSRAPTVKPSKAPSYRPTYNMNPTSFPSLSPSVQLSQPASVTQIVRGGDYKLNSTSNLRHVIVDCREAVRVSSDSKGVRTIYTVMPHNNSLLIISGFVSKGKNGDNGDILDLQAFSSIHSIEFLSYSTFPLKLHLPSNQTIIFRGRNLFDLSSGSIQFSADSSSSNNDDGDYSTRISSLVDALVSNNVMTTVGILVGLLVGSVVLFNASFMFEKGAKKVKVLEEGPSRVDAMLNKEESRLKSISRFLSEEDGEKSSEAEDLGEDDLDSFEISSESELYDDSDRTSSAKVRESNSSSNEEEEQSEDYESQKFSDWSGSV